MILYTRLGACMTLAILAACTGSFSARALADSVTPAHGTPVSVDVLGSRVVAAVESHGRYRIRSGLGAQARTLPVKLSGFFPTVHLGTDGRGGVVVTYVRCAHTTLGACPIYAYSFRTGRERHLSTGEPGGCGNYNPIMRHGGLVFTQTSFGQPRLRAACPFGTFYKRPGRAAVRIAGGYAAFDVRDGYMLATLNGLVLSPENQQGGRAALIRLIHIGHPGFRLLGHGRSEGNSAPRLVSGFAYWRTDTNVVRRSIGGGRTVALSRARRPWITAGDTFGDFSVSPTRLVYGFGRRLGEATLRGTSFG